MARTWQVRAAAALVGLQVIFGVLLIAAALRLLDDDPGFLFAIMPILFLVLAGGGAFVAACALALSVGLLALRRAARFQAAVLGLTELFASIFFLEVSPLAALVVAVHGGAIVALLVSPAAGRELGGWFAQMGPVAPWGQEPGTGPWLDDAPAQGPWSPDPTTLPWLVSRSAGPKTPWWEVWRAGLKQGGLPFGDVLVLAVAGPCFLLSLVALTLPRWRALSLPLLIASILAVGWVERRLRQRLAGR